MHLLELIVGLVLIFLTLSDAFETILLPRRVNRRLRFVRIYYRVAWPLWRKISRAVPRGRWREGTLSAFGPLSLLGLFGAWVTGLIFGFAFLQGGLATPLANNGIVPKLSGLEMDLYYSGTTIFTLGLGDVLPASGVARLLSVIESGLGFGFLAIIIAYVPVLYQGFSRREVMISLMDARAGSPPSGGEFLLRLAREGDDYAADAILREWERWCAELLEAQISFPILGFYRSQHANQSWLASLAMILDSAALMLTCARPKNAHQAQLTLAMARHAAVDITLIFGIKARGRNDGRHGERMASEAKTRWCAQMRAAGASPDESPAADQRLTELRAMYEPFLEALAAHLELTIPPVIVPEPSADNWQRSAWMPQVPGIGHLSPGNTDGDHFG